MKRLRGPITRSVALLGRGGGFVLSRLYRLATHPVFMVAVAIALFWGFYHTLSDDDADEVQRYQLLFMGAGFALCVVVVLWQTRTWTLRSLGILAEHFAGAVLYSVAGINQFWPIPDGDRRGLQDLARSAFFVAVMLLVVGLLMLVWKRRRKRFGTIDRLDPHYTDEPA